MTRSSEAEATAELTRRLLSAQGLLLLHLLADSDLPETLSEDQRQGILAMLDGLTEHAALADERLRVVAGMLALRGRDILTRTEQSREALRRLGRDPES